VTYAGMQLVSIRLLAAEPGDVELRGVDSCGSTMRTTLF
jgi:hypothetical protein